MKPSIFLEQATILTLCDMADEYLGLAAFYGTHGEDDMAEDRALVKAWRTHAQTARGYRAQASAVGALACLADNYLETQAMNDGESCEHSSALMTARAAVVSLVNMTVRNAK